jgi:RimJ/RimL family protein N-acetyltransferase
MANSKDTSAPQPQGRILYIVGKLVGLGPFVRDDLPLYTRWLNDFEVTRYYLDTSRPQTLEERAAWYERMSAGDQQNIDFAIYELATIRPIGRVGLEDISNQRRRATFGILVGEKDCWGKGYGAEATRLTLDYGFRILGLHNILPSIFSANTTAIRAYLRAGYREIGVRRERRREGEPLQANVYMEGLSTEFEGSILAPQQPRSAEERA